MQCNLDKKIEITYTLSAFSKKCHNLNKSPIYYYYLFCHVHKSLQNHYSFQLRLPKFPPHDARIILVRSSLVGRHDHSDKNCEEHVLGRGDCEINY